MSDLYTTETPKGMAEKAEVLGTTFLMLAESEPKAKVNMDKADYEACGTIACHAGWFGIAESNRKFLVRKWYDEAADKMAKFLGFPDKHTLKDWASSNEDLWGNENGDWMFTEPEAFGVKRVSLLQIGKHWLKVAERIRGAS